MSSDLKSYRPGTWFGIFGEHATVLLPPSEKRRVAALWELVDDGADFGEVLDALIASGLRDLPGFVLVSNIEGTTKVVLRGPAVATFALVGGETVDVNGAEAATWVERSLVDVDAMQLIVEEPTDGEQADLVISGGLVRVSRVDEPPKTTGGARSGKRAASTSMGSAKAEVAPVPVPVEEPVLEAPVVEEPVAEPVVEEPVAEMADVDSESVAASADIDVPEVGVPEVPIAPVPIPVPLDPFAKADSQASDAPVAAEPVAEQSAEAEPAEPTVEEPAVEEPAVEELAVEELAVEEPALDQPTYQEPAAEAVPEEPVWGRPEQPAEPESAPMPEAPAWGDAPAAEPVPEPVWGAPVPEQQPEATPFVPEQAQAPEAYAEPDPNEDHDGMTRAGAWDPNQFARQQPGIPGQPPAPSVTARPVARLTFSNGDVIDVDRAILVGRAPEARRFSSTDQPRLVTVPSPNQEISSTHLEIRPGSGVDHGTAIVTDMGSTNGTVLVQPGLAPEDLQPGIPVQLIPGAIVDLGDGVTISVTNP
ncbi:MAG TPA: FHA domain-containing protein [Nocardioides sp.]